MKMKTTQILPINSKEQINKNNFNLFNKMDKMLKIKKNKKNKMKNNINRKIKIKIKSEIK